MTIRHKDLDGLREVDEGYKGPDTDTEWELLHATYQDSDRSETIRRLRQLGQGIADNPRPLQHRLLARVIDRRAGLYQRAPSRFLLNPSTYKRVSENGKDHKAMLRAFERSQYNLFWREVEIQLALMFQVVIRFYPSSAEGTVVPRVFAPYNVLRDPDPSVPNSLEHDRRFALRLSDDAFEYFERQDTGAWTVHTTDDKGNVTGPQPYGADGLIPYGLPALLLYDRYPGGTTWLQPSVSRVAWNDAISAGLNDLWAILRDEAHSLKTVSTDDTTMVPDVTGPGQVWVLPKDAQADVLSHKPQLQGLSDALNQLIRIMSISEDLPASEFDESKQIVTGAARLVEEGPLRSRREARRALAEDAERKAYSKYAEVHNFHHGPAWTARMNTTAVLDLEVAPDSNPLDAEDVLTTNKLGLEQGILSIVDATARFYDVGRAEAIRILIRVAEDQEAYAPKTEEPDPPNTQPEPEEGAEKAPVSDSLDQVQGPAQE